jgi:ABC-type branched-subunit amino acid transport system ATPase component
LRDYLFVPSSRVKLSKKKASLIGPTGSPKTSVVNQLAPLNNPEDGGIQAASHSKKDISDKIHQQVFNFSNNMSASTTMLLPGPLSVSTTASSLLLQ